MKTNRPLKILIISDDFIPKVGGISHHVMKLSSALARRGNKVRLLATVPNRKRPDESKLEGVPASLVPVHSFNKEWPNKLRHVEFVMKGFYRLKELLRQEEFDIVHWHGLWSDSALAGYCRRNSGARLVFTNHSSKFLEVYKSPLKTIFLTSWLTRPDLCISPSRELAEKYNLIFKEVPAIFIPNGVDIERFGGVADRKAARKRLRLPDEGTIVLCPRRLWEKYGVHYLLQAIPAVPEKIRPCFVVSGEGPLGPKLKAMAHSLGISHKVMFIGTVPYDRMPILYHASDIAVIPSLMEATSLAALEAAACGLPIIASRVGGLADLFEGTGAAQLVNPGRPDEISKALVRLLMDSHAREEMGAQARRLAAGYTWDEIARKTEKAYISFSRKIRHA